jgi:hypothetical protein
VRVLLALCVLLASCATPPPPKPAAGPSLAQLASTLAIGRSTRSEVRAALGEGTVLSFDSDYEVWVYRRPSSELVLLFEPSGILSKSRLR